MNCVSDGAAKAFPLRTSPLSEEPVCNGLHLLSSEKGGLLSLREWTCVHLCNLKADCLQDRRRIETDRKTHFTLAGQLPWAPRPPSGKSTPQAGWRSGVGDQTWGIALCTGWRPRHCWFTNVRVNPSEHTVEKSSCD